MSLPSLGQPAAVGRIVKVAVGDRRYPGLTPAPRDTELVHVPRLMHGAGNEEPVEHHFMIIVRRKSDDFEIRSASGRDLPGDRRLSGPPVDGHRLALALG